MSLADKLADGTDAAAENGPARRTSNLARAQSSTAS